MLSKKECKSFSDSHTKILRILHAYKLEKNTKYREQLRNTFQKLFYKYARVYLIARKGYKDFQGSKKKRNLEPDEMNHFVTNKASRSKIESIAILFIEIFGTMVALLLGLWTQIDNFDWTSFE